MLRDREAAWTSREHRFEIRPHHVGDTDESDPRFGGGKYSPFQFGTILWKNGSSFAGAVYGVIGALYGNLSAEWGIMGWPTSQEVTVASRRRQDYEAGKINWTSAKGAWPTMTSSGNSSNRLDTALRPKVTAMDLKLNSTGSSATVTATAVRLTPGRSVQLRLTNPMLGTTATTSATVQASGTVNFSFSVPVASIWRVGGTTTGFVTFWVFQDAANQAVAGKSTNIGNNFPGQI